MLFMLLLPVPADRRNNCRRGYQRGRIPLRHLGEGNHFTAAAYDTPPTFTTASGGLLSFDGSNDILKIEDTLLFNAGAARIIYAVKGVSQADKTFWNEGNTASSNQIYQTRTGASSAGGSLDRIWIRNDSGVGVLDSNSTLTVFDNTLVVITITDSGASITVR